jgi:hypothetical protein
MAARKRSLSNSVAGLIESAQAIGKALESPITLNVHEYKIFVDVVDHREAASWTRNDLRIAANLAKNYRRMEELNFNIDKDGYTSINDRGTRVGNPEVNILLQVTSTVAMLNKMLGLSASQKGLSDLNQDKRNVADRAAKEAIKGAMSSDDLI